MAILEVEETFVFEGQKKEEHFFNMAMDPIAVVLANEEAGGAGAIEAFYLLTSDNNLPNRSESWPKVHEHHTALAMRMRRYYKHKVMRLMLSRDRPVSEFRANMYDILGRGPLAALTGKELSLVVKIPDFYREDKVLDKLEEQWPLGKIQSSKLELTSATLTLVDTSIRISKHEKSTRYWFRTDDDLLICLRLTANNPLEHLLVDALGPQKTFTITGEAYPKKMIERNLSFYQLNTWRVAR